MSGLPVIKIRAYHSLRRDLAVEDITTYNDYLHMNAATVENLLQRVAPIIIKQDASLSET